MGGFEKPNKFGLILPRVELFTLPNMNILHLQSSILKKKKNNHSFIIYILTRSSIYMQYISQNTASQFTIPKKKKKKTEIKLKILCF